MKSYVHLSSRDRKRIYILKQQKLSITEIAERIGKHRSTLYRELKLNSEGSHYLPDTAQKLTSKRYKGRPRKIQPDTPL